MEQNPIARVVPPLAVPLLAALVMYAVVAFAPQVLHDGDTFWHIAAGQKMLDLRRVLHTDPFSHTMPGAPWQTHEWLTEILMALSYRLGGWSGVVMLGGLAAGLTAFVMGVWLSRFLAPLSVAVALVLAMGLLSPSLLARPHIIAAPLMAIWVVGLLRAREADRPPPLWMLPLMAVWANMHGGYVFGLALIGPFALEALLGAPRGRWVEVTWRWGLFGVLALGAALITPHGIEGLIFPFRVMTMESLPEILEWRPMSFAKPGPFEYALLGTLFVAFTRGVRMPVVRTMLVLLLLHMALQHMRHATVLAIVAPLLLAQPFGRALEPALRADFSRYRRPALAVALAGLVAISAVRLIDPLVRRDGVNAPISALASVPEDLRGRPVFNTYSFGGYLVFSGVPVFIDGRADMYGDAFTARYLRAARGQSKTLEEVLAKHKIDWMILKPTSSIVRVMEKRPGWTVTHRDRVAMVIVRDDYGRSTSDPSSTTR